jgi:ABC-type polysaccharide/polyol phosphate transport system ATPase subunit
MIRQFAAAQDKLEIPGPVAQIAIEISGLGKSYRAGEIRPLADALNRLRGQPADMFWALQDISANIEAGSVVGIVGHNGAGKSTLLKILSRITAPSSGFAKVRGRVGSLLEVGTGFHPELTGRENIFLNGAILGMTRSEIVSRFDEIVEFSGVEAFIDTPVKRYSSGMYARLAFAVAAHLETEVLLVDEVLAVGDLEFQKKCLGRMQDTARSGRTVLFVSHNIHSVRELCSSALQLEKGRLVRYGDTEDVVNGYLASLGSDLGRVAEAEICDGIKLTEMTVTPPIVTNREAIEFKLVFKANAAARFERAVIIVTNEFGVRSAIIDLKNYDDHRVSPGTTIMFRGTIDRFPVVEGRYVISLHARGSWGERTVALERFIDVVRSQDAGLPFRAGVRGVVELKVDYTCELKMDYV